MKLLGKDIRKVGYMAWAGKYENSSQGQWTESK